MTEPHWLEVDDVLRLHSIQLAEFGGTSGIRDLGLLEAAVMRPQSTAEEATEMMLGLASGRIVEREMTLWVRANLFIRPEQNRQKQHTSICYRTTATYQHALTSGHCPVAR